ncbi:copper resistance CopC/CopD family protein [Streptomyces fildesensis]|uniref:Copper resistance CopC/CopD family protein n=1 Tax=Streptomyces fildesensis TaxID=375757 RepID=A0ABW8C9Q8_9ACTN
MRSVRARLRDERTTRGRRLGRVILLSVVAVGVLLGGAGSAASHAVLRGSDPADGAILKRAPAVVTLTFTEGVTVSDDSLRVLDPAGRRVNQGQPRHAAGKPGSVETTLRGNVPTGTFTVAWRVVSADSHPISGAFTFSIGEPSATSALVPQPSAGDTAAGRLYNVGRYVAYLGFSLLVGATAFVLVCWPAGAGRRPLRRLAVTSWCVLLVSTLALLILRGPYETGGSPGSGLDLATVRRTLGTRPGEALGARIVLLAIAGIFLVLTSRTLSRIPVRDTPGKETAPAGWWPERPGHRILVVAGVTLALALTLTWAAAEHASVGIQVPLAIPVAMVHLLAMALWMGGLAALFIALRGSSHDTSVPVAAISRFSRIAFASVVALVGTGIYQSWRQLGSLDALTGTSYGRWLTLKTLLVLGLLAAATYSRKWTGELIRESREQPVLADTPSAHVSVLVGVSHEAGSDRSLPAPIGNPPVVDSGPEPSESAAPPGHRRRLLRTVGTEVAIGVAVLAISTTLTGTQPGRATVEQSHEAASTTVPGIATVLVPFDMGTHGGRGQVQVTLEPGRVGDNTLQAVIFAGDGGIATVPELRITFTLREQNIGPLDSKLVNRGGYWSTESVKIPMAGSWTMNVTVRTSEIDQITTTRDVNISPDQAP